MIVDRRVRVRFTLSLKICWKIALSVSGARLTIYYEKQLLLVPVVLAVKNIMTTEKVFFVDSFPL